MDQTLTAHEPLLVNTIGHSFGVLLFALFLYFLLQGRASRLSIAAASLALVWNLSSLALLAATERELLVAVSTSALSLLPAVLLHASLGHRFAWVVRAGYALGGASVLLHGAEGFVAGSITHTRVLTLTTSGFAALTVVAAAALLGSREPDRALTSRLVAAMALFLLALSLLHFGHGEAHSPWTIELLAHHASVPLALIVLLQDYRFVLLDAFLRVAASLALAAAFVFAALKWFAPEPAGGVLVVVACLALVFYAVLRSRLQDALTHVVFGRLDIERTGQRLMELAAEKHDEPVYIETAYGMIAAFLRAEFRPAALDPAQFRDLIGPATASSLQAPLRERLDTAGVEAVIPVRVSGGGVSPLLLGHRSGGRRYLSEDLQAAGRFAQMVASHIEDLRADEMRRLVAQAELRALESQIHPHFLFNALNTLYGVIPRDATGARRTVLNLADILRYCLQPDRQFIPLEEELRIVEAYLEIEKLRLGERLRTSIEVDAGARAVPIPVLSLQPLVENAVKHAISTSAEGGEVRVRVRSSETGIGIRVEDTGPGFAADVARSPARGQGMGLANVRRRLELCYGARSELKIESTERGAAVEFLVPVETAALA
ncbi:MAG: histidine kinase [Bryobacteraceae bacterium]